METHYADYLKLDVLLSAQQPLSDHPDELQFIIVHQVHELWFKLARHHLERARLAMVADNLIEAVRLIQQVASIFENLTLTVQHLQRPASFHHFRRLLAPGSGLQSYQFRAIEFAAGMRDPQHIAWVKQVLKHGGWEQAQQGLSTPSVADALEDVLHRRDIPDFATVYASSTHYPDVYLLCDALSMLDHQVIRWRFSHIQLVERTIGSSTVGTGGTLHDYLAATLQARFFPALWEARNQLSQRVVDV